MELIIRCPACGALNRLRAPAGQGRRARCGACRAILPAARRELVLLLLRRHAGAFFGRRLPLALLAAVEAVYFILGIAVRPLLLLWRLIPLRARRIAGWVLITPLAAAYVVYEGTLQLSSLLLLGALLLIVMIVMLVAVRGPQAASDLFRSFGRRLFRSCPSCGYRSFSAVRNCPRCGA